jgi:UDP-glucose 4-epimerase
LKKILITGGLGQVGKVLLKKLSEQNIDFIVIDQRENSGFSDLKIFQINISNEEEIKKYESELTEITHLIHLATFTTSDKDVLGTGPESINFNIQGTINLLKVLPNLQKICYTSTYMVYGTPISNPVNEEHPTNPNVVYGASKLATEKYLQIFCNENKIELTILRLMGIYNLEKPHSQAIPTFIKLIANNKQPTIYENGQTKRNHLYIDDAIDVIITSIQSPATGIFNIGGNDITTNLELINLINKKLNKKIKPDFKKARKEVYNFVVDINKAKNELEFIPKASIDEGLDYTIKRFKSIGWE